jgi:hypothetical protein
MLNVINIVMDQDLRHVSSRLRNSKAGGGACDVLNPTGLPERCNSSRTRAASATVSNATA